MEELIFVGADGERETLNGVVNGGTVTIEATDLSVILGQDFTGGYFERKLPDGTTAKLAVTTYKMQAGNDGGAWFVVSVAPTESRTIH